MAAAHIVVKDVNKVFKTTDREVVALKDIQLEIPPGSVCLPAGAFRLRQVHLAERHGGVLAAKQR